MSDFVERPKKTVAQKHSPFYATLAATLENGKAVIGGQSEYNAAVARYRNTDIRVRQARNGDGTFAIWLERR